MKSMSDYQKLAQDEHNEPESFESQPQRNRSWKDYVIACLLIALAASVGCNVCVAIKYLEKTPSQVERTPFAKLEWDKWIMYEHGGLYNSDDEEKTNEAWDALNYHNGNIALDDDYVEQMNLPKAQRYPWDDTKGLYFVNGHHQLHCLKLLRTGFLELRDGKPLTVDWEHNMHCFNALRQEIMCTADDTPRVTKVDYPGRIGVGQYRQCRDWNKLDEWAKERWSCWKPINPREHIDTLLRYRYCPPESPYYERIHRIFGDFEMGENASATT